MKEWFLHYKEAIRISLLALFRWTLLAVCTGVLCGGIGTLFHLAVEWVTEQRAEQVWLLWLTTFTCPVKQMPKAPLLCAQKQGL